MIVQRTIVDRRATSSDRARLRDLGG